jgi:hypothetical protein
MLLRQIYVTGKNYTYGGLHVKRWIVQCKQKNIRLLLVLFRCTI